MSMARSSTTGGREALKTSARCTVAWVFPAISASEDPSPMVAGVPLTRPTRYIEASGVTQRMERRANRELKGLAGDFEHPAEGSLASKSRR